MSSKANCHYCGMSRQTTWDHIVPRSMGGSDSPRNKVRACVECNQRKAATWPTCECSRCDQARKAFGAKDPIMFAYYERNRRRLKAGKPAIPNPSDELLAQEKAPTE